MKIKNNKYQTMKMEQRRKGNNNYGPKPLTFSKKEVEEFRKKNNLPMLTATKKAKKKSNKHDTADDTKVLFEENDDYGQTQEISFDIAVLNRKNNKKSKETPVNLVNGNNSSLDHSESNVDEEIKKSRKKNKKNKNKQEHRAVLNSKNYNLPQNPENIFNKNTVQENNVNNKQKVNKQAKKRKLDNNLQNNDSENDINDTDCLINTIKNKKIKPSSEEQEPVQIINKLQQRMMERFQQDLTSLKSNKNNKKDIVKVPKGDNNKLNKNGSIIRDDNTKSLPKDKKIQIRDNQDKNKLKQNTKIIFDDDDSEIFQRNKKVKDDFKHLQNKKIIFHDDAETINTSNVVKQCNNGVLSEVKPKKLNKKKEKLMKLLEKVNIVKPANDARSKLRQRMMERLKAAQFRYLNEKLYTSTGNEAQVLFRTDPAAFTTYHEGYKLQVSKWPMNPLDVIVKKILKMPKSHVIADMGCGEAALSSRVPHTVHSLDLVAAAPHVTACDMANTPLPSQSVDVAVYCLSLMGTELSKYLQEANRVLKLGGRLMIAEVESRFEDVNAFTRSVERLGFRLKTLDQQHQVFFFLEFAKTCAAPVKASKLPEITLKPCLYKRR